jgi:hypothetical protein
MKKLFLILIGILIITLVSFLIFLNYLPDNSNPKLNDNIKIFFKALAKDDFETIKGLVHDRYVPKINVETQMDFWREKYGINIGDDIEIEMLSCRTGQLPYNNIGELGQEPKSITIKCSKLDIPTIIGGYVGYFNAEFRLNEKITYIEYSRSLELIPPYINERRAALKKIDEIPSEYKGVSGNLPFNLSEKTDYTVGNGQRTTISIASLSPSECLKLPVNPPEIDSKNANIQSICYATIAYVTGDISICEKTIDYSSCVIRYAQKRKDMTVCELLYNQEHEALRNEGRGISTYKPYTNCIKYVINNNPTLENCEILADTYGSFFYYKDECINSFAHQENIIEYCNLIIKEDILERCHLGFMTVEEIIAKNYEIFEICKKIESESHRNGCIHNIASALGNRSVCESITVAEKVSFCKSVVYANTGRGVEPRYNPNFFEDTGLEEYV